MTGPTDPRAERYAHRLLKEFAGGDPAAIDTVTDDLAAEEDPELTLLVLDEVLRVATTLLTALSNRVGANLRRAIEDSFPPRR